MATEIITGSSLAAAIWLEAAWGTETPTTAYALPISVANVNVGETQAFIDSQIARGTRKEQVPYPGVFTSDGNSFTMIGHYCSLIHMLKHVLGVTVTTTGDGTPYVHTLSSLTDLPDGFGLQIALVDPATAANSQLYNCYGCRVQSITIPIAKAAGEMDVQVQFVAKKVVKSTAAPISATTYLPAVGEVPIVFSEMTTLTINDGGGADAITDLIEASLTINMETEYQHTCNNSGRYGMFGSGITRIRGTGRAMLQSASVYEALAEAGTYCDIEVVLAHSANEGLTISLPYCRLMKKPIAISGPMGIGVDLEFSATEDPADATSPIQLVFNNMENGDDW
jgi:hypothetical protein